MFHALHLSSLYAATTHKLNIPGITNCMSIFMLAGDFVCKLCGESYAQLTKSVIHVGETGDFGNMKFD